MKSRIRPRVSLESKEMSVSFLLIMKFSLFVDRMLLPLMKATVKETWRLSMFCVIFYGILSLCLFSSCMTVSSMKEPPEFTEPAMNAPLIQHNLPWKRKRERGKQRKRRNRQNTSWVFRQSLFFLEIFLLLFSPTAILLIPNKSQKVDSLLHVTCLSFRPQCHSLYTIIMQNPFFLSPQTHFRVFHARNHLILAL